MSFLAAWPWISTFQSLKPQSQPSLYPIAKTSNFIRKRERERERERRAGSGIYSFYFNLFGAEEEESDSEERGRENIIFL